MKPFVFSLGLTGALLGACQSALAQSPPAAPAYSPPTMTVQPAMVYSAEPFGFEPPRPIAFDPHWSRRPSPWPVTAMPAAISPFSQIPDGHLWQDYRGTAIEHDFRLPGSPTRERPLAWPRSFASKFVGWFDNLTARWAPPAAQPDYESCAQAIGQPTLQFPIPPIPEPIPEIRLQPAPESSILKPARDPSLDDRPLAPAPVPSLPKSALKAPAIIDVPPETGPSRPPVVELAPSFVPPPAPAGSGVRGRESGVRDVNRTQRSPVLAPPGASPPAPPGASSPAYPTPPRNRIPVPSGQSPKTVAPR